MSRLKELKLKRGAQELVNVVDCVMVETYNYDTSYGYSIRSVPREFSERMSSLLVHNSDCGYSVKQIRSIVYDIFNNLSPNNISILQILGHLHPVHRELSILAEGVFGSKKIDEEFNWARFVFPMSVDKIYTSTIDDSIAPEYKFMGTVFSLFLKRLMKTFYSDYKEVLQSYGRLNNISHRIALCMPELKMELSEPESFVSFESIFKVMRINILRTFLENVDVGDIDTIVESVSENLAREFAYSNVSDSYVISVEKLNSFVEIFIYGLTNEYDVVYTILCNLIHNTQTSDECISEFNTLVEEYQKFEKLCTTDFKNIIGLEILIEFIFDYLIETDIMELIDIKTKINLFNDSVNEILKIKYFLDSEILCGSVSEPNVDRTKFKAIDLLPDDSYKVF